MFIQSSEKKVFVYPNLVKLNFKTLYFVRNYKSRIWFSQKEGENKKIVKTIIHNTIIKIKKQIL